MKMRKYRISYSVKNTRGITWAERSAVSAYDLKCEFAQEYPECTLHTYEEIE